MSKLKNSKERVMNDVLVWKFAGLTARILKSLQSFWTKGMNKYWSKMNIKQQKIVLFLTIGISVVYLFLLIIKTPSSYPKVKTNKNIKMNEVYHQSDSLALLEKIYKTIKNP